MTLRASASFAPAIVWTDWPFANGLAFGFTAYRLLRNLRGKFPDVSWFVYLLTALSILLPLPVARLAPGSIHK